MSTSEKTQSDDVVRVKVRSAKYVLERQFPKPEPLQHGLLYKGSVLRVVIDPDVPVRQFGMLLASTVAVGSDLGPFASGPGAKVLYVSGSGDAEADQHRLALIYNSFDPELQAMLSNSLTLYHRGMEGDDQIDLTTDQGWEVFKKSIPSDTEVVIIDYLPAFFPTENISHKQRKDLETRFRDLSKRGHTIVIFDVESKKRTMLGENRVKNTIYLTHDDTAPTQLGGGLLLHRSRVDDADSMPKCVSFWYTAVDGKLAYGFCVPDDENHDAPRLTKRLERKIKVSQMREAGMSQKTIAKQLEVHAATICRDCEELDNEEHKAEKSKARSSQALPTQQGAAR